MQVAGIILCGGRSSRMGQPKAWLPFGEERLLPRIVRVVQSVLHPIVIVSAPGQDLPPLPEEVQVVHDAVEGRGPLQGLEAGLSALPGNIEAAYLTSCDVPFLKITFVQRIVELLGDAKICVPNVGGYYHPLAAVYRREVLSDVRQLLKEDRLRPVFLFESVPTRFVEPAELADIDPTFQSLRNLNTPDDYAAALRDLA